MLLTIGTNHRTASSVKLGEITRAALRLRSGLLVGSPVARPPVDELAVLATCGRVEVFAACDESDAEMALAWIRAQVFDPRSGDAAYQLRHMDALRHLCAVAAGLDSVVLGEHEIAGQVARALRDAVTVRGHGRTLEHVAYTVARATRRVRAETAVGRGSASVTSAALDIARERLGGLERRAALVIGAGRAGWGAAKTLRSHGVASLTVVNRSVGRAREVADAVGGTAASMDDLGALIGRADVVISATGAERPLIDRDMVRGAVRGGGRSGGVLVLLDLAVPGDVEVSVADVAGVELVTLDDVAGQVETRVAVRREGLQAAEAIVYEVVAEHEHRPDTREVDRTIGELRRSVEEMRSREVQRWLDGGGAPTHVSSRAEMDRLTRSLVNKALHAPTARLRSGGGRLEDEEELRRAVDELFGRRLVALDAQVSEEG
jgi:glutamyl-tRNA reductase